MHSIPREVWRISPRITQASVATTDLEASSKHLGADAKHNEVGEVLAPEEDPPELLETPDLAEHVPALQRVHPAEETVLTVSALEEEEHPGTELRVLNADGHCLDTLQPISRKK